MTDKHKPRPDRRAVLPHYLLYVRLALLTPLKQAIRGCYIALYTEVAYPGIAATHASCAGVSFDGVMHICVCSADGSISHAMTHSLAVALTRGLSGVVACMLSGVHTWASWQHLVCCVCVATQEHFLCNGLLSLCIP